MSGLRRFWLVVTALGAAFAGAAIPATILTGQPFAVTTLFLFGLPLCARGFVLWWRFPPGRNL